MTAIHDAFVAARFTALQGRFKSTVSSDDYRLVALKRELGSVAGKLILDLGCGKGRFARHFQDAGARVVGVDLADGMLGEAAGLARLRATATRLPLASGLFDAVVAVEMFEHLAPSALPVTISEAQRVLRPGGCLLVIDKNATALDARRPWFPSIVVKRIDEWRGRWMYGPGDPVRERWFRPEALAAELAEHFDSVSCVPLPRPGENHRLFRAFPARRLMYLWAAYTRGGGRA